MRKNTPRVRAHQLSSQQLEQRQMLAADALNTLDDLEAIAEASEAETIQVAPIDGAGNNVENPDWGSTDVQLLRLTTVEYADGLSEPVGEDRPSAREISNSVAAQDELIANDRYLTDFVWLWGQFIDHDIDLSVEAEPVESFPIEVPADDALFDPAGTGEVIIGLNRSEFDVDKGGVRQQLNSITAYVDGSVIYGSDDETAASLRSFEGGKLLTSDGDLLPVGDDGFFMAGDVRANENAALTSMHTLWVREHNRLAEEIAAADPQLQDEAIYQQARQIVVAQLQAITYNQWLPALLGVDAISDYQGYDPTVNAGIANVFSTAAYRFGHSMLSTELLRLENDGSIADEGNLSLADAFFSPSQLLDNGIDSLLLGAASQLAQEVDTQIVDDVRNFLFGQPGSGGFDLASLNIQRGRDHGLADYNQIRADYGLEPVTSFGQITSNAELAGKLEALYGDVNEVDAWVGILAEDHVPGGSLGELATVVISDQFERIRDGDRFYYENVFSGSALFDLQNTTLADVIERNTDVTGLCDNVFLDESVFYYAAEHGERNVDVTLRVAGDELQLRDSRSGVVLQSMPAAEVNKIVLTGTAAGRESFALDAGVANLGLEGGIVIDGQSGQRDQVTFRGGRGPDTISVDGAFAQIDGTELQLAGIERLNLLTGRGPDHVDVRDDGGVRVVVDGRQQGNQGPRDQPRQRDPSPPGPHQRPGRGPNSNDRIADETPRRGETDGPPAPPIG